MKTRKVNVQILLFLIPTACTALTVGHNSLPLAAQDSLILDRRNPAQAEPPVSTSISLGPPKPEVKGTKDAPVDGQDGKPHAGPFVDNWVDKGAKSSYGTIGQDKPQIEDGVMNDPNHTPPKKGTTGTEGGVTEKERERKAEESQTGQTKPKTPDPPKQAPQLPNYDKYTVESGKKVSTNDKVSQGEAGPPAVKNPQDDKYPTLKHNKEDDFPKFDPTKFHSFDKQKPPATHGYGAEELDSDNDDDDEDDEEDDDEDGAHDILPWDSLAGSFSSIAATEIGDKTFIVAALMAMRHPRLQVFTAAFSALFIMTILSGVAGHAVGALVSKRWASMLAALLFLVFGAKSLREGMTMSADQGVSDEIREVQAELEEKEYDMARMANGHKRDSSISPYNLEAGRKESRSRSRSKLAPPHRSPSSSTSRSPSPSGRPLIASATSGIKNLLSLVLSPAWVETFSMTFIGELGDRSQIATVAMAAGQEFYWIMIGASLGHFVCTAVAVLGGSVLAGRVSMRKVTLIGGCIFIGFGLFTLLEAVQYFS